MSDAKAPLWSDLRIARAVGAADFRHYEEDQVEELMRQMRDEYQTELARLAQALTAAKENGSEVVK